MSGSNRPSFSAHRVNLAENFRSASDRTSRKPVTYKWISKFFADRADDLTDLKDIAAARKSPECFFIRCDRILTEMRTQSLLFKIGENLAPCAPRLMEMYALSVGRLTLSTSGRDQYAEEKDEEAMEKRFERQPKRAEHSDRLENIVCDLDAIWLRLNWPVYGCDCVQCHKRKSFLG